MGAHTFTVTFGGKGVSAADAYQALVSEAEREFGTNPYSGTIATTTGFVMVEKGRRRLNTVIREILENDRSVICKRGPAGCIALSGAALTDWRKRRGLAGTRAKAYVFFGWAAE